MLGHILEIISECERVAELNIQHQGVLSQLECPTRFVDEHKWIQIEKIYEIADWYIQYNAILDELVYLNTGVMETIKPMESFLSRILVLFLMIQLMTLKFLKTVLKFTAVGRLVSRV